MSRDLSDKQKWLLALAYSHAQRHDGDPTPITKLSEVFFDDDRYLVAFDSWAEARYAKSLLFQTRRLIQALIRRGLIEEGWRHAAARAGTALNFPVPASSRHGRGGDEHVAAGLVVQVERGLLGHLPIRQAQRVCTQSRPKFYSLPQRRCYARHGVDRPASRHAGPALPASTSSLVQHGCAAMPKPMIDIPLASLRCRPEALHGRPETADTVAAA